MPSHTPLWPSRCHQEKHATIMTPYIPERPPLCNHKHHYGSQPPLSFWQAINYGTSKAWGSSNACKAQQQQQPKHSQEAPNTTQSRAKKNSQGTAKRQPRHSQKTSHGTAKRQAKAQPRDNPRHSQEETKAQPRSNQGTDSAT